MPLRVLSLNLWNHSGPYPERAKRIAQWIDRLDPDLIGFQEALRGAALDQVGELLDGRGYALDYAPAVDFWLNSELELGNAIASRWPITAREELALPHGDDPERRVALGVSVAAPFGPISFTTTHLNWKLHHGYIRERQVAALCDWVVSRRPRDGFPPILCGDFNAEPDSAEIRYVCGLQSLEGRSVLFYDAWRVAGDGGPGTTWSNRNDYARLDREPDRRIDYVFSGYPQRDGVGMVENCRVVCDDADAGVWPSDHFGVYAEYRTEPVES